VNDGVRSLRQTRAVPIAIVCGCLSLHAAPLGEGPGNVGRQIYGAAIEEHLFSRSVRLEEFDAMPNVLLPQRMKLNSDTQVCEQTANAQVLLLQARCFIWVVVFEDWQKIILFGLEMLEKLSLEATPRRLTDRPVAAVDVIEQSLEELVQPLMVGE